MVDRILHKLYNEYMGKNKLHPVTIRFPIELFDKLQRKAEEDTRTVSQQIVHYIKLALRNEEIEVPTEERVEGGVTDERESAK